MNSADTAEAIRLLAFVQENTTPGQTHAVVRMPVPLLEAILEHLYCSPGNGPTIITRDSCDAVKTDSGSRLAPIPLEAQ